MQKLTKTNLIFGFILAIMLILGSCSPTKTHYFYSEIYKTDPNVLQDSITGIFESKNEFFDMYYSFSGQNISMKLSINNKMSIPLQIDWDKSSIQANGLSPTSISKLAGITMEGEKSEVNSKSQKDFDILKSAYFDFKSVNKNQLQESKSFTYDKKLKIKSINFNKETSPLILTSSICVKINEKDSIISNTFFISRISNLNKKTYNTIRAKTTQRNDGFFTSYEENRGKKNKFLDGVFEQLIKTSIYSINSDGIRNYPKSEDEELIHRP